MSATSSPYGFQPISSQSGIIRPLRIPFGVASGYGTSLYKYQPVQLNASTGLLQALPAGNSPIFGIFAGMEYTPLGGRPAESPFWPSGTVYDPSYDTFAYVWPAWMPDTRFKAQSIGSVPQNSLGAQFNVANGTAGSNYSGISSSGVSLALTSGVQGQFSLIEFATDITSSIGDAYTDLILTITNPQVGLGIQTGIG